MIYREDDWKAEVEILEDNSDEKFSRYKLKVIKTLRASNLYKPTKDGTIFCVDVDKSCGHQCGMWSLSNN